MYILKCKIFAENYWFNHWLGLEIVIYGFSLSTWKYVLQFVEIDKPFALSYIT